MKCCLTGLIAVFFFIAGGIAEIIHVPGDFSTIQAGIDAAQPGDTVLVAEGRYYENIVIRRKSILVASTFILDQHQSHIANTVIDGSTPINPDQGSVAYFNECKERQTLCQLTGFTLTGGTGTCYESSTNSGREGGGIVVYESDVGITYNTITGNSITQELGGFGAGISVFMNSASVRKIVISNNQITANRLITSYGGGGAIYLGVHNFDLLLSDNQITNNLIESTSGGSTIGMGAGIFYEINLPDSGVHQIRNNIISNNENLCSKSFGGGIHFSYVDCQSSTIPGNPNTYLYNNIISENNARYMGGGISVIRNNIKPENRTFLKQPVLINNTLVQNESLRGSGVFMLNAVPVILNSIIRNIKNPSGGSEIYGVGKDGETVLKVFNLYGDIILENVNLDDSKWVNLELCNYNIDPDLMTPMCHLTPNSPCIGLGMSTFEIEGVQFDVPDTDIFGNPRPNPVDSYIDIGAIESPFPATPRPIQICLDKSYICKESDELCIRAELFNPHQKMVSVFAMVYDTYDSLMIGSVEMRDDVADHDTDLKDGWFSGVFPAPELEATFSVAEIQIIDDVMDGSLVYQTPNNNRFTSKGPLTVKGYQLMPGDTIPESRGIFRMKLLLENSGEIAEVKNISAHIRSLVPWAEIIYESNPTYGDILAGERKQTNGWYRVEIKSDWNHFDIFKLEVSIAEDGFEFWKCIYDFPLPVLTETTEVPINFCLKQNYPNPFNPETRIDFSLPEKSFVSLVIVNLLGQEVTKLVQKDLMPGEYSLKWDGSAFPSGVYICSLRANEFLDSKKLVLIK